MLLTHHDVPLRTAAFELENRWLLWPQARLYADRLELTGWFFWGRYHRSVALDRIDEAAHVERHLTLRLEDGTVLRLAIEAAERWADAITTYRDVRDDVE